MPLDAVKCILYDGKINRMPSDMTRTKSYIFHFIFGIYPLEHGCILQHIRHDNKSYSATTNINMFHMSYFAIFGGGLNI